MSLVDEAVKRLKGKRVVVVTSVESEGYLQEIVGELQDGSDGCLIVMQDEDASPTIVNGAFVAWVYEDVAEGTQGN